VVEVVVQAVVESPDVHFRKAPRRRARPRAWPFRDWAADRWSRSDGRSAGTPRTGRASRPCPGRDRACPSECHTACSEYGDRRRPSARFYNIGQVIPAVVLAAGRSSRMGRAKATLSLDGTDSFLTRIVRTFLDAGVDDVVVVVGRE